MDRRQFVQASVATAAMTAFSGVASGQRSNAEPKISVFTKPFNSLTDQQLAVAIKKVGFDGIEAPIRKGGHVDLSKVETELPALAKALKQEWLEISIMASDINEVNDQAERILKTAASVGIKRYRLKYFKYDSSSIKKQLADWTAKLKDLAALNQQLGVVGLYQNHAGKNNFGASVWDLVGVLEQVDSRHLGIAFDIRHATVEGGQSWPTTMRRAMPLTQMLYVKDFRWTQDGKVKNVPLGEGLVDRKFLKMASQAGFTGPISLHEEYLSHKDSKLVPNHLEAMKRDLTTLKKWLAEK